MIGYHTDNSISQGVMKAFSDSGMTIRHINSFHQYNNQPSLFYGILRGTGMAMRWCKAQYKDYWYVDNGYFDAIYMDQNKLKDMSGKYRIVKNDMIEPYIEYPKTTLPFNQMNVLLLPPSPYSAFMHDTTPEDWLQEWAGKCRKHNCKFTVRDKELGAVPLSKQLKEFDAVIAFNSMGVMKAIEMGLAVYTTHGIIRNSEMFGTRAPYYSIDALKDFYEPKQFTLEEIREKGIACLK